MTDNIAHWNWNFSDICPTGIRPWIPNSHDLAPCFQELVFQLPMYVLLAVISSYYSGSNRKRIIRDNSQKYSLNFRIFFAFALGLLAAIKILYLLQFGYAIYPVDILLSCTEVLAWIVHIGFLFTLKKSGTISHRGPICLVVIWTSLAVLSAIWLHTTYLVGDFLWSSITFSFFVGYGLTLIRSGNAHAIRTQRSIEEERRYLLSHQYISFSDELSEEQVLGPAQDEANVLSRFVFHWVEALITKGECGKLKKNDDLFDLPECLNIPKITDKMYAKIQAKLTIFKALHKCFGFEFYLIGILRLLADLSGFAGPLLLGRLLKRTTDEDVSTEFDLKSYLYALGLFISSLIATFAGTHFNWRMTMVSLKMRMSLVTTIYRKTLEAKGLQNSKPEILNLMSTDCDRIVNSCISFHSFWSIPFQLFTTLYLLYTQLGIAFVAGVIFAVLLIPINRYIAIKIAQLSQGLMSAKDSRVSLTTETLSGAKQIKINAWEDVFIKKIEKLREDEVSFLSKRKYLDALCVYFWATTPVLICLLTFGTYVLMGKTLDAATVYTSVALLNMLIGPLNAFPWVLNGLAEAWVSLKRVQELINLPNINLLEYYKPLHKYGDKNIILSVQNGSFEFEIRRSRSSVHLNDHEITDFHMDSLNLEVKEGELVCLEGPVGGGKSSLLNALLGNLKLKNGHVNLAKDFDEGFGYVAQSPWLQRGTIRDNILWGRIYEERKYNAVIHACALLSDLETLGGDGRGIGEQGRTLSGGQKARVALARAVYQEKNIYLLDDILSAVDAHVATHIIKHVIFGLLKNKTRIVVTENMQLLNHANQILHVENGIVMNSDILNNLSMTSDYDDEADTSVSFSSKDIYHAVDFGSKLLGKEDDAKSEDSILMEESREYGLIDKKVISAYWKATTPFLGSAVLISVLLMQISRNLTDFWLANWVSHSAVKPNGTNTDFDGNTARNNTTIFYLSIYAGFAVGNSIITLIRAFLFAYAGIKAAKFIHNKLMNSVMFTRMQFFDITPLGRILNRFSSDVYTIDDSLPFILNILLAQFVGLVGALAISLYSMPWLLLLVIPLCPIYLNLQNKYRHASRDIRRLSSNALSPLYAHFTETLQGISTIRAMRGEKKFRKNFQFKLEESLKASLSASAAQQWLGFRIQILGAVLVGGSGLLAAITTAHMTSPEFVGLTISYSLSITSLLSGFLNAIAETEQEFVAVERVNQYFDLEKEKNAQGSADPPFGWPYQGEIEFDDVFLKYRDHLQYALKGITSKIQPCEKVGVVGRTGAGKSSLVSSILRVVPITKGTIKIDHVNIATLALDVLRTRVAVVPQEPFLFTGTVRENLDPRGLYLDNELWDAITSCLVSPLVQSLGGLSAKIDTAGSNLSAGQKQLLCLTRAMLKRSKIVLVDEGTANLDYESETAIQIVLKNQFKARTVLVIAHRLSGLNHADRILCMKNGEIYEEGTPYNLSNNSETYFYSMLQEQQNLGPHDKSEF